MASWDDVRRIALALPETEERPAYGLPAWRVKGKLFVWERPLRMRELEELGERAPAGPILAARVEDLGAKEALLADDSGVYFTTPHFDGHASVLILLERIELAELEEAIAEAWISRAPEKLVAAHLEEIRRRSKG